MLFVFDRDAFKTERLSEKDKGEIINTLRLYNKILTDFYVSDGKPALLNQFPASKLIRHHTFRDIGFLQNSGRIIVYDLAELIPVSIELDSPDRAEAVVLELWNYMYQKRKNRETITLPKGFSRGLRYYLIRRGGQWIIEDYEPVHIKEPEIREFRY